MKRLAALAICASGAAIYAAMRGQFWSCSVLVAFAVIAMVLAHDIHKLRQTRP
jgi:hypothetical protein